MTITGYYDQLRLSTGQITMAAEKPIISFRIRADLKAALEKLAKENNRSVSNYVETALNEHVKQVTKQKGGKR